MKKKQIDGDVGILLLGDVPADCSDIRKEGSIDQSWHFFCHLSDLTERKAERLIEDLLDSRTAKEAFYKMLSANGVLIETRYVKDILSHIDIGKYVFNPETTILFTSKIVP